MKSRSFGCVLLVVLCVLSIEVKSVALGLSSCQVDDRFLRHLKDKNVTIFNETSSNNDGKCGDEWSTYGTCCDVGSLEEYAKNDAGEIGRGLKQKRGAVEDQSKTALE